MSDNVDIYRKVLFRPPGPRIMVGAMIVLGVVFGTVSTFLLSPSTSLRTNVIGAVVASLLFYIVPAVVFGEGISRLSGITRNWTYMVAVVDQVTVFLFSLLIPFADTATEAWQVLWLGLATVFAINLLLLFVARGKRRLYMTLAYAFVFPGWLLLFFHLFIGRLVGIPRSLYLQNSVFFLVSAFLLLLTFYLYDFIIRANVDLSAVEFLSTLILDDEHALPGGVETDIHHQSLRIDNGEEMVFNVPWLHPGPVEGFGGGRLTSELIDDDTFMLHVPSYHTLDLADPADIDRFRNPPAAETAGKASKLIRHDRDGFTLYGRRYSGGKAVFLEYDGGDDFEPAIAYRLKEEHPDLFLVDLHNQPVNAEHDDWMETMDKKVRVLSAAVGEMVERLEEAETYPYRAGFAGEGEARALVEEVETGDGVQRTCLVGINGNGAPRALTELPHRLDLDHALTFTTDAHDELLDLASPKITSIDRLLDAVRRAEEDVSDAAAGIGEDQVEDVRVLGKDYEGLISTLNVMARIVPISLLLYYVAIVFLVM